MRNIKKKINRIAPFVISAIMLTGMSAAVYSLGNEADPSPRFQPPVHEGDEDGEDEDTTAEEPIVSSEEDTTTQPVVPPETTTTTRIITTPPTTTPPTTTPPTAAPPPVVTTTPPISDNTTTPPSSEPTDITTPEESDDTTTEPPDTEPEPTDPPQLILSFGEYGLTLGDGVQLYAEVINSTENYNIGFYSSNTNVVRVDASGYIVSVGTGSATVTAYAGDMAASAVIYVSAAPIVPEFIVLNESSFILKIDQTAQIQARLLPEEAAEGYTLTYTSDDPSIAEVNENGLITALSEGETTITVEGAGITEAVSVTVSADIAYETARLDGYLYDSTGKPMAGSHLVIDELSTITDKDGYFVFESVEQRSITIRLADDSNAACGLTVSGNTTVYLLYNAETGTLDRMASYEELAGQLAINRVEFISTNIVLTAGEIYELAYQYEPSDATVTGISYSSSNEVAVAVGQLDGIVTAKSPGEATITLSLNNGQAQAICTITVNAKESSEHSVLIVVIEAVILAAGTAAVLISYRKYRARVLSTPDEDDEDDDIHDIE